MVHRLRQEEGGGGSEMAERDVVGRIFCLRMSYVILRQLFLNEIVITSTPLQVNHHKCTLGNIQGTPHIAGAAESARDAL